MISNKSKQKFERLQTNDKQPHSLPAHLAFLPTTEGEVSFTDFVTPASPGQGVEDDSVDVIAAGESGVEVHCDVLRVMTDVDGKAAMEAGTQR